MNSILKSKDGFFPVSMIAAALLLVTLQIFATPDNTANEATIHSDVAANVATVSLSNTPMNTIVITAKRGA